MAQVWQSTIGNVPMYSRIFEQIFFFSDRKKLMAHLAQAKIKLLSLVYLANRCAKGVGTAWHSSVFGVRDPFCFFKNFFAQKFYL